MLLREMQYLTLILIIVICALFYVRFEQPVMWNQGLAALKAPNDSTSGTNAAPDQAAAPDADASTNIPPAAPPAPAPSTPPEIISPNSTNYLNPDHVRPVMQPGEETNAPATNAPSTSAPATNSASTQPPTSIPSTITTISGQTYTECVLSRVTPDGISFTHSMGVAKVPFTDLDPALAAQFGYDPVAAKKYEEEEAQQASESDALRQASLAASLTNNPSGNIASVATSTPPAPKPSLSSDQRGAIQNQIAALQADINFMQSDQQKKLSANKTTVKADGRETSRGAYDDKIASEEAQVDQLQQQLQK